MNTERQGEPSRDLLGGKDEGMDRRGMRIHMTSRRGNDITNGDL